MSSFCPKALKMRSLVIPLFLTATIILLTQVLFAQTFYTDLESKSFDSCWLGLQTVDSGIAYSGNNASVTKTGQPYGIGFSDKFPEEVSGENVWLVFSGRVFADSAKASALFVVTLEEEGKSKYWHGIQLMPAYQQPGQWHFVTDSILFPASLSKTATIKAYLWNQTPKIPVWVDDPEVRFRLHRNPSFIPELPDIIVAEESTTLYANAFYQINYDNKRKVLTINNSDGNRLVESVQYTSMKWYNSALHQSTLLPKFVKKKRSSLETRLVFSLDQKESKTRMILICRDNSPEIKTEVTKKFLRKQEIERESLILTSALPVSSVLKANRKTDTTDFKPEYWLDKQGVVFGNETSNWWIYHTPQISSLQLNSNKQQLWINLDYDQDHPFFRYPLAPDTTNWQIDISKASRKRGQKQTSTFAINVSTGTKNLPRLMKNPAGFLSTYIFSEHADWTNLATHRATYFGADTITRAENAVGGFVYYQIPVTKSVFYANPDSIKNTTVSAGLFNGLEITIQTNPQFLGFLKQIYARGSEICLHTPDHYTTTPSIFEESMAFMQKQFNTVSWIDHGNNNGLQNNREDLVCDATLQDSPFYALDIWKKYGVKYLHNSYYEDMKTVDFPEFNGSIAKPFSGFGDFYPKPDYWRHETHSKDIIHWPTTSALFVDQDNLWDYYFSKQRLKEFANEWDVKINHCYPAWVDPKKGFWTFGEDSVMIAQPGFNRTLERMAQLREQGDLNTTTVADFLSYNLTLEQVEYAITPSGNLQLTNNGNTNINNLAMTSAADFILVNGLKPAQKQTKNGIVFWFNLPAGQSATIRYLSE